MSNLPKTTKKSLPDIIREEKLLKEEVLAQVIERQKSSGAPFHRVLQEMNVLTEQDLTLALCKHLGLPYVNAAAYHVSKDVEAIFEIPFMMNNQFVVLDKIGRVLLVAIAGPPPSDVVDTVERRTGSVAFFYISTLSQIETCIGKYHMAGSPKTAPSAR